MEKSLGQNLVIFAAPVDTNVYPEYSKVVKHPMDLGTIRLRLERRLYNSPQEFCDVSAFVAGHIQDPRYVSVKHRQHPCQLPRMHLHAILTVSVLLQHSRAALMRRWACRRCNPASFTRTACVRRT